MKTISLIKVFRLLPALCAPAALRRLSNASDFARLWAASIIGERSMECSEEELKDLPGEEWETCIRESLRILSCLSIGQIETLLCQYSI
jgi:hypothetical protein